ncbi:outer membrane beta-barrel protein [Vibrio vulnificus]
MKKLLTLATVAIAISSAPAIAAKRVNPQTDGASIHAGIGHSSGSFIDGYSAMAIANGGDAETNTANLGLSYTFSNGQFINLGYVPSMGSFKINGTSIETPTVHFLGGYQFRSGIRLFGGASLVMAEGEDADKKYNDKYFGGTIGAGYLFANNISVDLQTSFITIENGDLSNTTINLGYKF